MKESFDQKTKPVTSVNGRSVIVHSIRRQLELNCSAYVMMDFIYDCVVKRKEVTIESTFKATGFDMNEQKSLLNYLVQAGFIYPLESAMPKITPKWANAFTNMEEEFAKFWQIDGKNCWPGSKANALTKFRLARKESSLEQLLSQRDKYFEYLEWEAKKGFNRAKMQAERWLNPKNEHYLEHWSEYTKDIKKFLGIEDEKPKEVLTKDKRNKLYAEDPD